MCGTAVFLSCIHYVAWVLKVTQCCNVGTYVDVLFRHKFRVALHEEANRMNASALAIVFAPCILRTNKIVRAQDSLHDIGRQTQCIETIVAEQLRKVRSTLADIDTLDTACHTATHRLSSLRSSKV
jgi:myosin-9